MIPVKKAATPQMATKSPGIASRRLLKKVSPPFCPENIRAISTPKNIMERTSSSTDNFPRVCFGKKDIRLFVSVILLILILQVIKVTTKFLTV